MEKSEIELVHLPTHCPLPCAAWQSMSLVPGCSILRFAQNNTKRVLLVMLSGAKHLWLLFLMSLEKLSEILRFAQNDIVRWLIDSGHSQGAFGRAHSSHKIFDCPMVFHTRRALNTAANVHSVWYDSRDRSSNILGV